MNKALFIVFYLISTCIFAQSSLPDGCKSLKVAQPQVKLYGREQTGYFILNKSGNAMFISAFNSASLLEKLDSNRWSVLTITKGQEVTFSCIEIKPGSEQKISCQDQLRICQVKLFAQDKRRSKTVWLSENKTLEEISDELTIKQIVLNSK